MTRDIGNGKCFVAMPIGSESKTYPKSVKLYKTEKSEFDHWKMIYDDNRDVIGANPDLILPKQQFRLNQDQNVWERYRQ